MHRHPSQSFERSNISCRRNLLFYRLRFSPNSDRICTESNLHVFCSKRYTGSVSISIETSARARFEFIQHIRDLATKIARDVSTDLSLHYSILPVRRTGHVAPNPTYTFSAASTTRGVCRFLSKQARRARFEFIQHIRDLARKIARDVSTDLSLNYSILPVRRTGHGS